MIYQKIWSCSNQTHIKVWTLYTNNCSFMYVWEIKLLAYEVFPILNQELSKPWATWRSWWRQRCGLVIMVNEHKTLTFRNIFPYMKTL